MSPVLVFHERCKMNVHPDLKCLYWHEIVGKSCLAAGTRDLGSDGPRDTGSEVHLIPGRSIETNLPRGFLTSPELDEIEHVLRIYNKELQP